LEKPSHGSKILISTDTLPISYHNKAKGDFKKLFYSKKFFESWKSQNNINISYSDLFKHQGQYALVRGLESLESDRSVFIIGKRGPSYIYVKTDNYKHAINYFDYARHINNSLTEKYLLKISNNLKKYENRHKYNEFKPCHRSNIECSNRQENVINNLIQLYSYTIKLNQDSKIFDIQTPSLTEKAPRNILKIIITAIFYGLSLGIIFISYLSSSNK
tara:strand:+ start:467 stop:1117 length:651 start_codon:yes stop_codon:yes gene_type:complete